MPDPGRDPLPRRRPLAWISLFFLLALSFWFSADWLALCAGLALFLFGVQCRQASSLMNDLGYVSRITQSLRNVLLLGQGEGGELFRSLRRLSGEEGPLIRLD